MLGIITPEQRKTKEHIESYLKIKTETKRVVLTAYSLIQEDADLEELLRALMDPARFKRAKKIKDEEINLREATNERVRATVRRYHVLIDVSNKTIYHDCADWSRCAPMKKFCKHLGKLFLYLPEEKATQILRRIHAELHNWEFKPYVS